MDDISKKINKSREDKKNFDSLHQKSKQNFVSIDTSIYDETLKEIDYVKYSKIRILDNYKKTIEKKIILSSLVKTGLLKKNV